MRTSRISKPIIAVTMGDPSGVGPEVTVKALASLRGSRLASFFVVGDGTVIDRVKKALRLKIDIPLLDLKNVSKAKFCYGKSSAAFGKASIEYIDMAADLVKNGYADAIVTAPINKLSIERAGHKRFQGHTEYLAEAFGAKDFAMMFVGKRLKISLVTRHIALKDVPRSLTAEKISKTIILTARYLKKFFKIKNPRIGVAGLNPHAGENGLFGDEEERLISPAIKRCRRSLSRIYGPIPPDAIFFQALEGRFDAVVSMYHDQALIPFKMLYFKDGVNLTIGLPFVRTSPDHGTAFDIAGKMEADPSSMIEAMRLAADLAGR